MRKLLLASSALFILSGGIALAHNGGGSGPSAPGNTTTNTTTTTVKVPVENNAASLGAGNASSTGGGDSTASNGNWSHNTVASGNTSLEASLSSTKDLNDVGNTDLAITRSDTRINVTLAESGNTGSVGGTLYINDPSNSHDKSGSGYGGALTGDASMRSVNGGSGILTAQQNTGVNALQQNSVALGSVVGGGTGFSGF
jgi:hypothetical protein